MDLSNSNNKEKLAVTIAATALGFLLKRVLDSGYSKAFDEDPPDSMKDEKVNWGKVLAWSIVSGVAVTLAKGLLQRYADKKLER